MEINTLYKQLLSDIGIKIKPFGYKRTHSSFTLQEDGNWGIINFQKSTESNSETILFTINLGVASSRLLRFFATKYTQNGPNIWDCHWGVRLGHLLQGKDIWWTIETKTSIEILGEKLWTDLQDKCIPEIARYIHDPDLRDLWLSGSSPSLTEFQRLINLSVLLKEIGPQELLEPVLSKLNQISLGKPTAISAAIYTKKILGG